jgi:hypothetical protein
MSDGRHIRQAELGSTVSGPGSLDYIQLTIAPTYTAGANVEWDFASKTSSNACLTMTNDIPANGYVIDIKSIPVGAYGLLIVKRPAGNTTPLYIKNASSAYGTIKSSAGETYPVILNPSSASAETVTVVEFISILETAASVTPVLWITSSYLQPWTRTSSLPGVLPVAPNDDLVFFSGNAGNPVGGWSKIKREMLDENSVGGLFLTRQELMSEDNVIRSQYIDINEIKQFLINPTSGNPIYIEDIPVLGITGLKKNINLKGLEVKTITNRNQSASTRSATSLRSISRSEVPVLMNQYFS